MQERVTSALTESFVEHQPLEQYVINTTAFHNAHLLRRCLPRSAWAPVPMFTPENRLQKHNELAEQLRGTHVTKKAAAAAARAHKRKAQDEGLEDDAPPKKKRKASVAKKRGGKGGKSKGKKKVQEESDIESDGRPGGSDASGEESDSEDGPDHRASEGESSDEGDSSEPEHYIVKPTRRPRGQAAAMR